MTRIYAFKQLVPRFLRKGHSVTRNGVPGQRLAFPLEGSSCSRRCVSTSAPFMSKKPGQPDDDFGEVQPPAKPHPLDRTTTILMHDFKKVVNRDLPPLFEFQSHVDMLIIGGGIIGSTIAYYIKERTPREALKVMVIEKDPDYTQSATAMSVGGMRKHFTLRENIEMAQYSLEFLRQVPHKLSIDGVPPPSLQYHPYGYLQLANEEQAQELQESWLLQKELGCHVDLLTNERLKEKFPWMNTEGVELATYGTECEGWFDAWALHFGMKRKAAHLGTEYVHAEVVGFDFEESTRLVGGLDFGEKHYDVKRVIVKTRTGELKTVDFAYCIIAAGHESANIAEMARVGRGQGLLSVALPVEPRKRHVYCVHAPDGPGIDCPLVSDVNGTYFRREGYAGHFVAGYSPPLGDKPDAGDLEINYANFDNIVWPSIALRAPGFRNVKLNSAWAGYYDYNTFDQNGVIGPHPYYPNLYFACGFSGHGIQQAPAVARAVMEMLLDGEFRTLDLTKYHFERFFIGKQVREGIVN